MSSEQQERQAMQYVERSSLLTVRTLLKLLEWSARQALAQDSAYKIGVQKMEELLQSPYAIEAIDVSKDILDKPIDVEKFKELMESENCQSQLVGKKTISTFMPRIRPCSIITWMNC